MTQANDTPCFRPALVLPTYNNAPTLAGVIERCLALGLPVFVVNDGSTDGTAQLLQSLPSHPNLRVISHGVNQGKAGAMCTGFAAAAEEGHTHAVTMDTDGQLDPAQVPMLLDTARKNPCALILGVRDFKIDGYPARNRLGRRLANCFIFLECGVRVTDSQCGLRVYPLGFIEHVPIRSGRFGYETEVITRAGWARTPVVEVPVTCRYFAGDKRVTHFKPWRDTMRAIGLHLRLAARGLAAVRHTRWPEVHNEKGSQRPQPAPHTPDFPVSPKAEPSPLSK